MYNKYCIVLLLVVISVLGVSCSKERPSFSADMLLGKWKRPIVVSNETKGYDCYRYDSNGVGVSWDTSEDVSEDEAQLFEWNIDNDRLLIIHKGEMGQKIPKTYTVKTLNSTELSYEDNYGNRYSFKKFTQNP